MANGISLILNKAWPEKLGINVSKIIKIIAEISIAKLSKVNVVIVNDKKQILRYLSRNIYSDEIIIGMGAGSISQWIRDLKNKL